MNYVQRVREAYLKEIAAGRIGTPVFVRLVSEVSSDHGHLLESTARGVVLCEDILDSPAEALFVLGSLETGHLNVQVDAAGGKSALITVALMHNEAPRLDLLAVGNRGTVRHAPESSALLIQIQEETPTGDEDPTQSKAQARRKAVEESLRSGKLVRIGKDDG